MNNNKKQMIDRIVTIGILILCLIFAVFKIYNKNVLGVLLIGINTYMLIKYRKHKLLFLAMLMIWYFNYSIVITKYIGPKAMLLENLYQQLTNSSTMYISIIMQIVFSCIINLIVGEIKVTNEEVEENKNSIKWKKIFVLILQLALGAILIYHLVNKITYNTTLFEYSILLFILALYYSKGDKKNRIITEVILGIFSIYSILIGERIAVLQFLIVDFVINYLDIFKIKYIISCIVLGIVAFTVAGLYGDFLDYGFDFKDLTPKFIIEQFGERRLALDTSVSAYFSGISMVDVSNKYTDEYRLNNAIEYFTKYTLLGGKANYETIEVEIREHQVNYGGGFITCYFYFWFGWIGVILISVYVGILFRIIKNVTRSTCNTYLKMLAIFVVGTLPRWYLYVPTMLFRGILIFSVAYAIMHFIVIKVIKKYFKVENIEEGETVGNE